MNESLKNWMNIALKGESSSSTLNNLLQDISSGATDSVKLNLIQSAWTICVNSFETGGSTLINVKKVLAAREKLLLRLLTSENTHIREATGACLGYLYLNKKVPKHVIQNLVFHNDFDVRLSFVGALARSEIACKKTMRLILQSLEEIKSLGSSEQRSDANCFRMHISTEPVFKKTGMFRSLIEHILGYFRSLPPTRD